MTADPASLIDDRPGDGVFRVDRAIFSDPYGGLIEDPVTGSLNASAAEWMLRLGHVTAPYPATQGTRLGRSGRIRIEHEAGGPIWVGGATATLFAGTTGAAAVPA